MDVVILITSYAARTDTEHRPIGSTSATGRIEQRPLLRREETLDETAVLVRGGADTRDKLRRHVQRTARAWSLDGWPLLGISVFAVIGIPLDELLWQRFANFRCVYLPTMGELTKSGFELLPTARRPHLTVRLYEASDDELDRLLAALGDAHPNPAYATRRELT